jgi:HPt (histidine-containing phosphotransfer) domain-containing protein/anti-sigma regulatory factor (Ser/Thr protein kinase)
MAETLSTLAVRAHRKGLELALNVDQAVPAAVIGDVAKLRQVVVNLVGNAIKFTERGEIVVDVRVEPATPGADDIMLQVTVCDTGIGIPADKQSLIFDPFAQADASTTRLFGGTGLGLAISSKLVQAMGGELRVDSEPGRGSSFHFTARLLAHRVAASAPSTRAPESLAVWTPPVPTVVPPIDMGTLLQTVAGDDSLARELLGLFAGEGPDALAAIRAAVAREDACALETSAHTLKGSAMAVRATQVVERARSLEAMGRAGSLEHAASAVDALEAEMGTACAWIMRPAGGVALA